jgi:hypothetical protein
MSKRQRAMRQRYDASGCNGRTWSVHDAHWKSMREGILSKRIDFNFDADIVKEIALAELEAEYFDAAVKRYKEKLRQQRWWHRAFPWKVVLVRRDSV